jgi:hypothetical protein
MAGLAPEPRLPYPLPMVIELSGRVEEQLQDLAGRQGRDVESLVDEAVREYLIASAITDLDAEEVAATLEALVGVKCTT